MSEVYGEDRLATRAFFWRIERRDGVTLGFTSHDRDLMLDGVRLRAAPGIRPAALRLTSEIAGDDAQMDGAITHDAISAVDLEAGRFDGAGVTIGSIDWQSGEARPDGSRRRRFLRPAAFGQGRTGGRPGPAHQPRMPRTFLRARLQPVACSLHG